MRCAMEIRRIQGGELPAAMDLCWRVFLKFEAPDYAPEGVEAFRAYLSDIEQVNHLTLFGAWEGQELLGVLAAEGSHIALFFVDPAFHRQGIGRLLFQAYLAEGGWSPAAFPAWMHWTIQSRFRAKFRMVCIPSASWRTSSGVLPWTMFQ